MITAAPTGLDSITLLDCPPMPRPDLYRFLFVENINTRLRCLRNRVRRWRQLPRPDFTPPLADGMATANQVELLDSMAR